MKLFGGWRTTGCERMLDESLGKSRSPGKRKSSIQLRVFETYGGLLVVSFDLAFHANKSHRATRRSKEVFVMAYRFTSCTLCLSPKHERVVSQRNRPTDLLHKESKQGAARFKDGWKCSLVVSDDFLSIRSSAKALQVAPHQQRWGSTLGRSKIA